LFVGFSVCLVIRQYDVVKIDFLTQNHRIGVYFIFKI